MREPALYTQSRSLASVTGLLLALMVVPAGGQYPAITGEDDSIRISAGEVTVTGTTVTASAGDGSCFPNVVRGADGQLYACWLEPDDRGVYHLPVHRLDEGRAVRLGIVPGDDDWFVNWADFPSVAALEDGTLAVHYLQSCGDGVLAYGARVVISKDGGRSWGTPFWLHDDLSASEHGFVTLVPVGPQQFHAVWLDGRDAGSTGNTALWSRTFDVEGRRGPEQRLDGRVCSCCQTGAVRVGRRTQVVYRDRSASEIRDIALLDAAASGPPVIRNVYPDRWKVPG